MSDDKDTPPARRRRVLFMAEAVTLAHVARPHALANALPTEDYEILFACDPRYNALFADAQYRRQPIHSVSSDRFLKSLSKGSPLYDFRTLQRYVEEDLAVIDAFRPDVIVGDFRLSLSVSARLRETPYIGISNAYWSPQAAVRFAAPDLPMSRLLGPRIADLVFRTVRPLAFAVHARPINRLRRASGLAPLRNDIRHAYTDADLVLFADVPELVALRRQTPWSQFIGPIGWSPRIDLPSWWAQLDRSLPTVYVTLGSSGNARLLPQLLAALSRRPLNIAVSTAGSKLDFDCPANVFLADYLPGDTFASLASIVVCNGGSPTSHQGLLAGCPIVGIPGNLDQVLNMAGIESAGVGVAVRPSLRAGEEAGLAVDQMLVNANVKARVTEVQESMQRHSSKFDLRQNIEQVIRGCGTDLQDSSRSAG